jgi:hypothetical protein
MAKAKKVTIPLIAEHFVISEEAARAWLYYNRGNGVRIRLIRWMESL